MKGLLAISRLFWRPATLWNLSVLTTSAVLVGRVAYGLQGGLASFAGVAPEEIARSNALSVALAGVLVPVVPGGVTGWALFELLLAPCAPLLPKLRSRLLAGLLALGLLSSAGTAWWCAGQAVGRPFLVHFALAFLAFGLAVLASDPLRGRRGWLRWGVFAVLAGGGRRLPPVAVLVAEVVLAREVLELFADWSVVLVPLALFLGAAALALPLRAQALRRRVLDPRCAQDLAYRSGSASLLHTPGSRARVAWSGEKLGSDRSWTRAACFEGFGWASGGWIGASLGAAAIHSTILVAFALVAGLGQLHAWNDAVVYLSHVILGGGAPFEGVREGIHVLPLTVIILPLLASLTLLGNPIGLSAAPLYPLSRARRARIAWRASLVQILALLAAFALVLAAVGWLAQRASGIRASGWSRPEYLLVLAWIGIFAPLVQWVRVHFLQRSTPPGTAFVGGLCGGLFLVVLTGALFWLAVLALVPIAAQPLVALGSFAASQAAWRVVLNRHYRSGDLVV